MATKASRIALAGSNISSTGEVDADLLDNIDSAAFLSLDGNSRLGIGETSPLGKLHVKDGDAGSITTNDAHDTVIIEGSGNTGINIFSPNTSYQYLAFGDTEGSNSGYVRYQHSNNQMVLRAGSSDTVYINDGKVGIGTTGPSAKLTITDENAGQAMLQVRNFSTSATGSFGNAHSVELRSATSTTTHGVLIHHHENAIGRRSLDVSDANGIFASFVQGKVGIGTVSPATSLHVKPPSGPDGFAAGGKALSMTTSFQTGAQLEITLGDHRACYVKVFITGDWSGHSAVAFLGEYFIQNGANGYAEAGMIIREVDNTAGPAGDHVSSQIYDGGNVDSFQIQFKLNAFSGGVTTLNGVLTYQVMGQFNAIT